MVNRYMVYFCLILSSSIKVKFTLVSCTKVNIRKNYPRLDDKGNSYLRLISFSFLKCFICLKV